MQLKRYWDYIDWRAKALMAGRHEDLARHYLPPALFTVGAQTYALNSHEDVVLELHRLRIALMSRGIDRLSPQIDAIELPRQTQRIWVTWRALGRGGELIGSSNTVYHFDRSAPDLRAIAMTHRGTLVPDYAKPAFRNRLQNSRLQGCH